MNAINLKKNIVYIRIKCVLFVFIVRKQKKINFENKLIV